MDMKSAIARLLDRLQTFRCASCGGEIKLLHTFDPTQGFYFVSRRTNKAYYQSLLLFILNPEESSLMKFKNDERLENIFQLNADGTFKHFYILCKDCYTGQKPGELEFFEDLGKIFSGRIHEEFEQLDFVEEEHEEEDEEEEDYEEEDDEDEDDDYDYDEDDDAYEEEDYDEEDEEDSQKESRLTSCKNCGHMISKRATKCPKCGEAVVRFVTCEDCGAKVPADADECPECGGPLDIILYFK